ncbi:hypothetical protein CUC08_Gglean000803 [Alternaria sp. MG1]|jgi:hypothetical protein|nr:hypothetical protein CUC08_Gglean000803 [Alternaria sp. MG1]RYN89612.1 hypothetical protein AA0120_g6540 [Alternaria tenuissima]
MALERAHRKYDETYSHKSLLMMFHEIPRKNGLASLRLELKQYRLYYSFMGQAKVKKGQKAKTSFDIDSNSNAT